MEPDILQPLRGLRVVELGIIVSAPTVGLIFADLGAEVIKIENTINGDPNRENTGSPGTGQFDFLNRNKKSVSVNLKTESGREVLLTLLKTADIFIENMAPRVVDQLGIEYDVVRKLNDRIIYCSIKGFGGGPYSERKLTDYPAQAESGLAYMTGLREHPMRAGASVLDMMAANMVVISSLSILLSGAMTGRRESRRILVGMFETGAFLLGPTISRFLQTREIPEPLNEVNFRWAIYDFFSLKEGKKMFIGIINEKQWDSFCDNFELNSLKRDPRFTVNEKRLENKKPLMTILNDLFISMNRRDIIDRLQKADVLFAELNRPDQLVDHVQLSGKLLQYKSCFEQSLDLKLPTLPVEIEGNFIRSAKPAPKLGEDTDSVLMELGFNSDEIREMKKKSVIR